MWRYTAHLNSIKCMDLHYVSTEIRPRIRTKFVDERAFLTYVNFTF